MPRTMAKMAQEAIDIQNACNIRGLSKGYAKVIDELAERLQEDKVAFSNSDLARHPISQMWASKLHDLCGMGLSDTDRYGVAYAECRKLAGIE
jgi:hypothetical protein